MKVGIIYWTGTGNTETMANAIAEGVKKVADVEIKTVGDLSSPDDVLAYDKLLLGCPAMGDEVLEEDEFQPFYDEIKGKLGDKLVGFFGPYDWGEGEWMESWCADAEAAGIKLFDKGYIIQQDDLDNEADNCALYGENFAKA